MTHYKLYIHGPEMGTEFQTISKRLDLSDHITT